MRSTTFFSLASLLFAAPACGDDVRLIDAGTLQQHWPLYLGQRIELTGCTVTSATPEAAQCHIKSKTGGTGSFTFVLAQMPRDDIARAVADCSFYVAYPLCRVRLTGEVAAAGDELLIIDASIAWSGPQ